jgi:hypothetical protein
LNKLEKLDFALEVCFWTGVAARDSAKS